MKIKVKSWFANKVLNEKKVRLSNASLYAILKETDKAVYGMMADSANFVFAWFPKSCLEEGGRYNTYEAGYQLQFADGSTRELDTQTAINFWKADRD